MLNLMPRNDYFPGVSVQSLDASSLSVLLYQGCAGRCGFQDLNDAARRKTPADFSCAGAVAINSEDLAGSFPDKEIFVVSRQCVDFHSFELENEFPLSCPIFNRARTTVGSLETSWDNLDGIDVHICLSQTIVHLFKLRSNAEKERP